eukprot:TRINITY_DN13022_c0_g1_i4.p1 TRINITY_DN13022_c0_g1~~TRINITY_DN13022_c0_g1_i4.p1  ORF type:complete len:525 (+),score=84.58 TRINITY_DN13022_c0_g1_i4:28-1602(+)
MFDPGGCEGFSENSILAVKSTFVASDLQQILILKNRDGIISYHYRECEMFVEKDSRISDLCKQWFNHIVTTMQARLVEKELEEGSFKSEQYSDAIEANMESYYNKSPSKNSTHQNNKNKTVDPDQSEEAINHDLNTINSLQIFTHNPPTFCDPPKSTKNLGGGRSLLKTKRPKLTGKKKLKGNLSKTTRKDKEALLKEGCNEEDLSCKTCGKQFAQKVTLVRHIKNHQRLTEECRECGMKVKNLVKHSKTQHQEKDRLSYYCDICGRGFKDTGAYSYHMTGHTGERNYNCSTCNKSYRNSSEQKKCEKGHQGIFKYNCNICGYRTHQKNKYVRHCRVHTKENPYSCPICHLSLARKDYLQKHILKQHREYRLTDIEQMFPLIYQIPGEREDPYVIDSNPEMYGATDYSNAQKVMRTDAVIRNVPSEFLRHVQQPEISRNTYEGGEMRDIQMGMDKSHAESYNVGRSGDSVPTHMIPDDRDMIDDPRHVISDVPEHTEKDLSEGVEEGEVRMATDKNMATIFVIS